MATQKQKDRKKLWIRALCVFLAILMIDSSLVAILNLV